MTQLGTESIKGFVVEGGLICPAEAVVKDTTTDCLDLEKNGQKICWHKKFLDKFEDICLRCKPKCKAYAADEKPLFGKLINLKKFTGNGFSPDKAAALKELYKIYNDIPSVGCAQCGKCCSLTIQLYAIEFINISEYIKNKFSLADQKRFRGLAGMNAALGRKELGNNQRCIFIDKENRKCSIYEARPLICRLYKCKNDEEKKCLSSCRDISLEKIYSLSERLFVIQEDGIIISKENEMNRWFLL